MSTDIVEVLEQLEVVSCDLLDDARHRRWESLQARDQQRQSLLDLLGSMAAGDIPPDPKCLALASSLRELDRRILALVASERQSVATESRVNHARASACRHYRQADRLTEPERS